MPDIYDKAIAYLKENPEEISNAWHSIRAHEAGCLFAFCTPTGGLFDEDDYSWDCGCLTTVRDCDSDGVYKSPEFTQLIKADEGIPNDQARIEVQHLERFAYWQRRLDALWPGRYKSIAAFYGSKKLLALA